MIGFTCCNAFVGQDPGWILLFLREMWLVGCISLYMTVFSVQAPLTLRHLSLLLHSSLVLHHFFTMSVCNTVPVGLLPSPPSLRSANVSV